VQADSRSTQVQQNTDRRRRAYAVRYDSLHEESPSALAPSDTDAGRLPPPSLETSRLQGIRMFNGAPRSGLWSSNLSSTRGSTSVSTSQAEGPGAGQPPSNYLPGLYSSVDARARLTPRIPTATPTSPLLNRAPNGLDQQYPRRMFNEIDARDMETDRFSRPLPDRYTINHGFNSFHTTFSANRSATTALNALAPDSPQSQRAQPDPLTGVSIATGAAPHGPGFGSQASATSQLSNSGTLPRFPPFLLRSLRDTTFAGSGIAADPRNYALESEMDTSYEGLTALAERVGNALHRGVNAAALATSMTVFAYAATAMQTGFSADDETEGEIKETRCAICLEDYEDDDQCARSNKCGHALHEMCFKVSTYSATRALTARID
jgi:hypothetical protein